MVICLQLLVVSVSFAPFVLGNFHSGNSTFLATHKDTLFFVNRGKIHKLPQNDNETITHLRLDPSKPREISVHHFHNLIKGEDIPSIHLNEGGPDDIFRVFSLVNKVLQGRLIEDLFLIGKYINPSLVPFRGRLLMATGLAWSLDGLAEGKPASEFLEFRWINHTSFPFYSKQPYCGITENINPLQSGGILGQDPRMVIAGENRIVIVYTNRFEPRPRMGAAELIYNSTSGMIQSKQVLKTLYFSSKTPEKNWSPFVFNNHDVYLIQSINPLRIMGYIPNGPNADTGAAIVASEAPLAFHPFQYGHLRGGTNAIDIGDRYLAIFHSTKVLPGNYLTTYFMGAFTFTKTQPWRLLSISPEPIMDDWMYQGPYAPFKNRKMDYVVFPNSLNRLNEHEILIGFGYQDNRGYAATVKLKALLESMVPFVYCDDNKHPDLHEKYCSSENNSHQVENGPHRKLRRR